LSSVKWGKTIEELDAMKAAAHRAGFEAARQMALNEIDAHLEIERRDFGGPELVLVARSMKQIKAAIHALLPPEETP
jgi:hypothetical protein